MRGGRRGLLLAAVLGVGCAVMASIGPAKANFVVAQQVATGPGWQGLDVDPSTNTVLSTSDSPPTLWLIDGTTLQPRTVALPGRKPTFVTVDPPSGRVFVTDFYSNQIDVVDETTGRVLTTFPVGGGPVGVRVDEALGRLYVPSQIADDLEVYDLSTYSKLGSIALPAGFFPTSLTVDPGTHRVYVVDFDNGTPGELSVIDGGSGVVLDTIVWPSGTYPSGVAIDEDTSRAFVTGYGTTVILDTSTDRFVETFPGGNTGSAFVNQARHRAYWGTSDSRLAVYDESSSTLTYQDAGGIGGSLTENPVTQVFYTAGNQFVQKVVTTYGARITSHPPSLTNLSTAEFGFDAYDPDTGSVSTDAQFQCSIDDQPASPCTAGVTYRGLADGFHRFWVEAEGLGTDQTRPLYVWTSDTTPPYSWFTTPLYDVLLPGQAITGTSNDNVSGVASVHLQMAPTLLGAPQTVEPTLHCNSTALSCSWSYVPTTPGEYSVSVYAVDRAGNVESPPQVVDLTVL